MKEKINIIHNWLGQGSINLFGKPFSGKDTQGAILREMFGSYLIAGGDILRSQQDNQELQKILSTGDLIPSEMYLSILLPYLSQDKFKGKPLFLSAVGRKKGEEEIILKATEQSSHPIKAVITLELEDEEVHKRFKAAKSLGDRGSRQDDDPSVLINRLLRYNTETQPVIEFYAQKGLLIRVDGSLSRQEVTEQIIDQLHNLAIK